MDGEEVGLGDDLVERQQLDAELATSLGGHERVEGDQPHAERPGAVGDELADAAEAGDAERLVGELDALPAAALPASGDERGVGLRDVAGLGEEQRHRVLGGGDDVALGGVDDHHAAAGGGLGVDVVEPDPGAPDDKQVGPGGEHLVGDVGGRADDEGVGPDDGVEQLGRREVGAHIDLVPGGAQPIEPTVGDRFRDQDPRHPPNVYRLPARSIRVFAVIGVSKGAFSRRRHSDALQHSDVGMGTVGLVPFDIRAVEDPAELRRVSDLFGQVWGSPTPVVPMELLRAIGHAGGYVVGAYDDDQVVGGSVGFLGRHRSQPSLHSHVTGILPGVRGTGLGRDMKLHQKAWAAAQGLAWVTWTFDPLVRRNAWFNIAVLGADVHEYLVNFYGPIDDAINAGDESDRLLVGWAVGDGGHVTPARPDPTGTVAVATPDDIVVLRRTDSAAAAAWRQRVRRELGGPIANGATVRGVTEGGDYLLAGVP